MKIKSRFAFCQTTKPTKKSKMLIALQTINRLSNSYSITRKNQSVINMWVVPNFNTALGTKEITTSYPCTLLTI